MQHTAGEMPILDKDMWRVRSKKLSAAERFFA